MNDTADIQIVHRANSTLVFAAELDEVASVRYQGGWCLRLVWSPEDITVRRVTSRECGERLAIRHAGGLLGDYTFEITAE